MPEPNLPLRLRGRALGRAIAGGAAVVLRMSIC